MVAAPKWIERVDHLLDLNIEPEDVIYVATPPTPPKDFLPFTMAEPDPAPLDFVLAHGSAPGLFDHLTDDQVHYLTNLPLVAREDVFILDDISASAFVGRVSDHEDAIHWFTDIAWHMVLEALLLREQVRPRRFTSVLQYGTQVRVTSEAFGLKYNPPDEFYPFRVDTPGRIWHSKRFMTVEAAVRELAYNLTYIAHTQARKELSRRWLVRWRSALRTPLLPATTPRPTAIPAPSLPRSVVRPPSAIDEVRNPNIAAAERYEWC